MSSSDLIRWSGLSALVGGVLLVVLDIAFVVLIGDVPENEAALMAAWVPLLALSLIAVLFVFLGLVGMYAHQAEKAGSLGLVAFLVAFVGTALYFSLTWAGAFIVPALAEAAPDFLDTVEAGPPGVLTAGFILTFLLFALGWLLFGLATLRTRMLPRGAAVLLMIGAVLSLVLGFLAVPVTSIVLGATLAWLGYALWSEKGEEAKQPEPAT